MRAPSSLPVYCTCRVIRLAHQLDVVGSLERLEIDHLVVAAALERRRRRRARRRRRRSCRRRSSGRSGRARRRARRSCTRSRDRRRPRPPRCAPLLRTANRSPATPRKYASPLGRAVQRDVADDDVLLGDERRAPRRIHDDLAARQSLADVVVRVALERQRDAARHERAEALAGRAGELQLDRVVRQPFAAVPSSSPRSRASCRRSGSRCGSAARATPACRCSSASAHRRSARCRAPRRGRDPARVTQRARRASARLG